METIKFEGPSSLKMIGEQAFMECKLDSITILALTEEIDGAAFVNCPLISIQVAPGSLNFKIEGNLLLTFDGTEIVRYFGLDREIVVGNKVEVLGKSCFEGCKHLDRIDFEIGSELERIGSAALRDCIALASIDIPATVTIIEEGSFEECEGLESCSLDRNSILATIGARAFAKCTSLRSFDIPPGVGQIGSKCFNECNRLHRREFLSLESVKRVVGDQSLEEALNGFCLNVSSSLFMIDVEDGRGEFEFPGWISVSGGEGDLQLSLVRDIQ
jgi:hypothetical protein